MISNELNISHDLMKTIPKICVSPSVYFKCYVLSTTQTFLIASLFMYFQLIFFCADVIVIFAFKLLVFV